MKDPKDFCTCTDFRCPNHPRNHDRGCGPCIEKNLKQKEIPTCFFRAIDCEKCRIDICADSVSYFLYVLWIDVSSS